MATVNISYDSSGSSPLPFPFLPLSQGKCSLSSSALPPPRLTCCSLPLLVPSGDIIAHGYDDIVYNLGDMAWVLTSTALVLIM